MSDATIRFTVSLPGGLLDELDARIVRRGYSSRSELVRDLIRKEMVRDAWAGGDTEMIGVLAIAYDHHQTGLTDRLHAVQHKRFVHVLCTQHVHIDHHNCLETIVLRGHPDEIAGLALEIGGQKGVRHAELTRMGPAEAGS
jgi:CopG family nickel-responsive transcriptional regulator